MTLIEELESDKRCGCWADGIPGSVKRPWSESHCVTCRAAARIAALEQALLAELDSKSDWICCNGADLGTGNCNECSQHRSAMLLFDRIIVQSG